MNYMSILIFSLLCLIAVLVYMTRQVLKEVLEELRLQGIHLKSLSEKFGGKREKDAQEFTHRKAVERRLDQIATEMRNVAHAADLLQEMERKSKNG